MKVKRVFICGFLITMLSFPASSFAAKWNDGEFIHEYQLIQSHSVSWDDAALYIKNNLPGWYLATITSQDEQDFLIGNVFVGLDTEYWLGGYQEPDETSANANWKWVTGEPWAYTNWAPTEPNDNDGPGSEQYLAASYAYQWKWNDENDLNNIFGFVAEQTTPVPEPVTMVLFGSGFFGMATIIRKRIRKKVY